MTLKKMFFVVDEKILKYLNVYIIKIKKLKKIHFFLQKAKKS